MPQSSRRCCEPTLAFRLTLFLTALGLDVEGKRVISFLVARRLARRGEHHGAQWKAYRRQISSGLLAVMRLDAANRAIEDSYTGGFIAGLARDWDLLDCAKLATATAAIVATGLGSGANLVSFEETVGAMNTLPVRKSARA